MNKKTKAALAGLAFLAGCEIGIAVQLLKMIHKFTVRESAMDASIADGDAYDFPEDTEDAAPDDENAVPENTADAVPDVQDEAESEDPESGTEDGALKESE